jgi:lysophospholipase
MPPYALPLPLDGREAHYEALFRDVFLPHYQGSEEGWLEGVGGKRIHYRVFPCAEEKASVVLLPGRTESHIKYAETLFDLNQAGYTVFTLDHRGQGYSERLSSDPELGHVETFDDYVTDLRTFMREVVAQRAGPNLYFLAHSMGAAIASGYLLKDKPALRGIVFSSPMLRIHFGRIPRRIVYALTRLRGAFGHAQRSIVPERLDVDSYGADLTRSEARLAHYRRLLRENPGLRLGPPSNHWMRRAIEATDPLLMPRALHAFPAPVLLLEAGCDTVLRIDANRAFEGLGSWMLKATFPDAMHDLFIERDTVRKKALTVLFLFLQENAREEPPTP